MVFRYDITSPVCISFAVGDVTRYWYDCHVSGYYWAPGVGSADTMEGWLKLFAIHGYMETNDPTFDPEFEKIAVYALDGIPEHVARQESFGRVDEQDGQGARHRTSHTCGAGRRDNGEGGENHEPTMEGWKAGT